MLPPRTTGCAGSAAEDRGGQRRRRRLALRAGHPDRRGRAEAQERGRSRDTRAGAPGRPPRGRHQRGEGGPQARLGRRVVGLIDGDVATSAAPAQAVGRIDVRARRAADRAGPSSARSPSPELGRPGGRRRPSRGAGVGEEAGQGDPAAGQAQDGDRPAARAPPTREVAARSSGVERRARRAIERHRRHPSALIEARKSVTPSSPARTPTIQKRIVIFSSSQPPSSKWWWSGAIRKIRRPPVSLK